MIRGIHHVAVHVRDLDRMITFYRQACGVEIVGDQFGWSDDKFVDAIVDVPDSAARGAMLRAGTCYMELFQYSAPAPVSDTPLQILTSKAYSTICWSCSLVKALSTAGAKRLIVI